MNVHNVRRIIFICIKVPFIKISIKYCHDKHSEILYDLILSHKIKKLRLKCLLSLIIIFTIIKINYNLNKYKCISISLSTCSIIV